MQLIANVWCLVSLPATGCVRLHARFAVRKTNARACTRRLFPRRLMHRHYAKCVNIMGALPRPPCGSDTQFSDDSDRNTKTAGACIQITNSARLVGGRQLHFHTPGTNRTVIGACAGRARWRPERGCCHRIGRKTSSGPAQAHAHRLL